MKKPLFARKFATSSITSIIFSLAPTTRILGVFGRNVTTPFHTVKIYSKDESGITVPLHFGIQDPNSYEGRNVDLEGVVQIIFQFGTEIGDEVNAWVVIEV